MAFNRMERLRRFIEALTNRESARNLIVTCEDYGHKQVGVLLIHVYWGRFDAKVGIHREELKGRGRRRIILERAKDACQDLNESIRKHCI